MPVLTTSQIVGGNSTWGHIIECGSFKKNQTKPNKTKPGNSKKVLNTHYPKGIQIHTCDKSEEVILPAMAQVALVVFVNIPYAHFAHAA